MTTRTPRAAVSGSPASAAGSPSPEPLCGRKEGKGTPAGTGITAVPAGPNDREPGAAGEAATRSPAALLADPARSAGQGGSTLRTFVIELPPGTSILPANHRKHRYAANDHTQALKAIAIQLARVKRLPRIERADILTEYFPPPRLRSKRHPLASERVEDGDALAPTSKALVDGWVKAGVFPRDTKKCLRRHVYEVKPQTHPRGLLRVTITEVAGDGG